MADIVKKTGNGDTIEAWDPFRAMRDWLRWDPFREMARTCSPPTCRA